MTMDATMRLSWCPEGIASQDQEGEITFYAHETANFSELSEIQQEETKVSTLLLPLEHLLTRTFTLPLKNTRLLDASILSQELADAAGTDPEEWWLSWKAFKTESGIKSIVFGLPWSTRQVINETPALQKTSRITVDGWVRLNNWLKGQEESIPQTLAIIDCDASGAFFCFIEHGVWQGIRRLNADMHDEQAAQQLGQQVAWSLQSMGFDSQTIPVVGRLTPQMEPLFPVSSEELPRKVEASLPERHLLNLQASMPEESSPACMNLRHGKWAVKQRSSVPDQWKRPMVMAAMLSLIWLGSTVSHNYLLESDIAEKQDIIINAFQRGVPGQPVIDALAQLKQAAQQSGSGSSSMQSTQQLSIISAAYKKQPWQMKEIKIDDEGTLITGVAESMEALNTIRQNLSAESATEAKILDTDLSGDQVTFKVNWK